MPWENLLSILGRSFAAQGFSNTQAFFGYRLLAYILKHYERSPTSGALWRQPEEETGKLISLERLGQYLATFLKTVLNTLAHFGGPRPQYRAYLTAITNAFKGFSPLPRCET